MYPRLKVKKAELESKDGGGKLTLPFNPTQLSLTIGCSVKEGKPQGPVGSTKLPIESGGPQLSTIKFDFILDSTEPGNTDPLNMLNMMNPIILALPSLIVSPLGKTKVNDDIVTLLSWTDVLESTKKSGLNPRPHVVYFSWGDNIKFTGMISSLSFEYLLFDSDGNPRRAKVSFELKGHVGKWDVDDIISHKGTSEATSEGKL
jgi:hypothetical protein